MITGSGTHLGVVIDDGIYQNIVAGRARQEERTPPPMIILREERKEMSCTSIPSLLGVILVSLLTSPHSWKYVMTMATSEQAMTKITNTRNRNPNK